jgi:prepilin-type N-terminal cleavage/methylation domain-containing protein
MTKRVFTLIELLVVIAVIALLTGILMPALNVARDQGRLTACMSNMRQVGPALTLYQADYEYTPPKTQAVFDYASPASRDNVLKLLRPMVSAEDPDGATPAYACPALRPNPNPAYAPTRTSRTGYLANAALLGRRADSIPNPGRLIVIQEGWSLSNHLWIQPEPITRTEATLPGRAPTRY